MESYDGLDRGEWLKRTCRAFWESPWGKDTLRKERQKKEQNENIDKQTE